MKVDFDFIKELLEIKEQLQALCEKRDKIVENNTNIILKNVYNMMDWSDSDVSSSSVKYSPFERYIMIDIRLKKDRGARYVFELGSKELNLRFTEDFCK